MDPKKREDLLGDMRDLVDTLLIESLEDLGYPRDFSTITGKPDLEVFLNGIRQALRSESENQVINMIIKHYNYCQCWSLYIIYLLL